MIRKLYCFSQLCNYLNKLVKLNLNKFLMSIIILRTLYKLYFSKSINLIDNFCWKYSICIECSYFYHIIPLPQLFFIISHIQYNHNPNYHTKFWHPKCLDIYIKPFWKGHKYESQKDVFGNKINKLWKTYGIKDTFVIMTLPPLFSYHFPSYVKDCFNNEVNILWYHPEFTQSRYPPGQKSNYPYYLYQYLYIESICIKYQ